MPATLLEVVVATAGAHRRSVPPRHTRYKHHAEEENSANKTSRSRSSRSRGGGEGGGGGGSESVQRESGQQQRQHNTEAGVLDAQLEAVVELLVLGGLTSGRGEHFLLVDRKQKEGGDPSFQKRNNVHRYYHNSSRNNSRNDHSSGTTAHTPPAPAPTATAALVAAHSSVVPRGSTFAALAAVAGNVPLVFVQGPPFSFSSSLSSSSELSAAAESDVESQSSSGSRVCSWTGDGARARYPPAV